LGGVTNPHYFYGNNALNYQYIGQRTDAMVIQVAQDTFKKVARKYYTYQEFFVRTEGNKISMSNVLQNWYTARKLHPYIHKFRFLFHSGNLLPQAAATYRKLYAFWAKHYVEDGSVAAIDSDMFEQMIAFCDKIALIQEECLRGTADEDIAKISKQLLGGSYIEASAYNHEILEEAKTLEPLEDLIPLMQIMTFTHPDADLGDLPTENPLPISHESEVAVREYIAFKLGNTEIAPIEKPQEIVFVN
jgi:hypothetical protein